MVSPWTTLFLSYVVNKHPDQHIVCKSDKVQPWQTMCLRLVKQLLQINNMCCEVALATLSHNTVRYTNNTTIPVAHCVSGEEIGTVCQLFVLAV
jgi:hypothetical protein